MQTLDIVKFPFLTPEQTDFLEQQRAMQETSDALFKGTTTGYEMIGSALSSAARMRPASAGEGMEADYRVIGFDYVTQDLRLDGLVSAAGKSLDTDSPSPEAERSVIDLAHSIIRTRRDSAVTARVFASALATGQTILSGSEELGVNPWQRARLVYEKPKRVPSKVVIKDEEAERFVSLVPEAETAVFDHFQKHRIDLGLGKNRIRNAIKVARHLKIGQTVRTAATSGAHATISTSFEQISSRFPVVEFEDPVARGLQVTLDKHYQYLRDASRYDEAIAKDPRARLVAFLFQHLPTMHIGDMESRFNRTVNTNQRSNRTNSPSSRSASQKQHRRSGEPRADQ